MSDIFRFLRGGTQMKKCFVVLLCAVLVLTGCNRIPFQEEKRVIAGLDTSQEVNIQIAIPYETNKALNTAANSFMKKFPNVNIHLQYVEDYDNNALKLFKENAVDIILQKDVLYKEYTSGGDTNGEDNTEEMVMDGTTTDDFFYNFSEDTELDFSDTTSDISDNYHHTRIDEDGKEIKIGRAHV